MPGAVTLEVTTVLSVTSKIPRVENRNNRRAKSPAVETRVKVTEADKEDFQAVALIKAVLVI